MAKIETIFPLTTNRNEAGGLVVAGIALEDLAKRFGTPLYVYDAETIRTQVAALRGLLAELYPAEAEIAYAAKAYFSLAMAQKLAAMGLSVDVVSLGELMTAARAGFGEDRVHLHGNNKSAEELAYAIAHDLQAVVVDSLEELEYLEELAQGANQPVRVWLRITPGLSVDTHPYRQTGHASSKFGFPIPDGQAEEAIRRAMSSQSLRLTGLHMHLGSQIFETEPFGKAIQVLLDLAERCQYIPEELSPGGGWGVAYTSGDEEADPRAWVETVCRVVQDEYRYRGWKLPKLVIEPGRWLVARAGMALYRIGTHKTASDGSKVVAVDGGMADNPRPALYHAQYTACLANRLGSGEQHEMRIVGKFCESGDELIHAVQLPDVKRGDLLAIPVAGAYQLSMASNYNLALRPAVLWLDDGKAEVLQKRETLEGGWWQEG